MKAIVQHRHEEPVHKEIDLSHTDACDTTNDLT